MAKHRKPSRRDLARHRRAQRFPLGVALGDPNPLLLTAAFGVQAVALLVIDHLWLWPLTH